MDERATSFGSVAGDYERGRPAYPADAVAWLAGTSPRDVVDVGAGTGKLARGLTSLGHRVTAVDPDPLMLDALRASTPGVAAHVGAAESLPLPDACADVVTLGQAWHWVDPDTASRETGRVLRPGGTLGLIWNIRDEREPWVARLTAIMHVSQAERLLSEEGPRVAAPWGPLAERAWDWSRPMTADDLTAMVRSRSHWIAASAKRRGEVATGLDSLIADLGIASGGEVEMPYVTRAFRATLPSRGPGGAGQV